MKTSAGWTTRRRVRLNTILARSVRGWKSRLRVPFLSVFFYVSIFSHSLPAQIYAGRTSLPPEQAIPSVSLIPTSSPRGEFTVNLPENWSITPSTQGDGFLMTPSGRTQPSISIVVVGVSDLRYLSRLAGCTKAPFNPFGDLLTQCIFPSVEIQLSDSSRGWTPEQGLQLILQTLQQSNRAGQFGAPVVTVAASSRSFSQAFYRVTGASPSGPVEHWGVLSISYVPNPMLGQGRVTSLAFLADCSAPPEQSNGFRRGCAGVISSFRPSPPWESRLAAGTADIYQQESQILLKIGANVARGFQAREQMINSFGQSMQRMQQQTFNAIQSQNYRNGQGWIATFAGNTLVEDPVNGRRYEVPYGYSSYGIDDRGLTPVILMGPNEGPGRSIGSAQSQRSLVPAN
jgi:hypothetical protein